MMRLRWTRTVLCALGFVWVMLAWHGRQRRELVERDHLLAQILRICTTPGPSYLSAPEAAREREECELTLRLQLLAGGTRVSGTVDVSGNVDVSR
jgi:hypothetical protein